MRINFKLLAAVAPLALATAIALPSPARADAAPTSSRGDVRDHRTTAPELVAPTEKPLNLRVGQPLMLADGNSLILRPGGVVELTYRARKRYKKFTRTFQNATIVEDDSGVVWIISPNNITPRRRIEDLREGTSNTISMGERVRAGMPQRTSPSSRGDVRDHRTTAPELVAPTETRLNLRIGQPLKLDRGNSLILRPGGVLEFVSMNGLVARTFQNATIVEDDSGVVWIVSGIQRVRAGMPQRTSPSSRGEVRDHRTTVPQSEAFRTPLRPIVRNQQVFTVELKPTETRLNLRIGQPLKLDRGNSLILRPGGVLEYIGMNGLVARSFQNATIVEDDSGVVWIVSGIQRVRAGMPQR